MDLLYPIELYCATYSHDSCEPKFYSFKNSFAKYGGRQTITALPGDGIGPEMVDHVRKIFSFAQVPVDFELVDLNSNHSSANDFEKAMMAIRRNGVALKGNIESKVDAKQQISSNMELRKRLDLFANTLHCVSLPKIPTRHHDIDVVLIRFCISFA
ncbi:hypothetical protein AB6A40_004242 [Gnathostoma spinigerum]|uniref:Isopropylmalate dehydrogenase-like domain-containing protein n=1 Tax=Gnathostoma spinigerum TaxID=75299 RepID=A0ABD6EKN8_9BILA